MTEMRLIKVFMASPGDVLEERQLARDVFDSINRTTGKERGIHFEVVGWDTDSHAAYGKDGQALIGDQIGNMSNYELFIGIMWNRFGSSTPRANSGTEEEFELAVKSFTRIGKPDIKFYFNTSPFSPQTVEDSDQKTKVLLFRDRIRQNGLTVDYRKPGEFQRKLRDDIESWLATNSPLELVPPRLEAENPQAKPDSMTISKKVDDSGMWFLLGNGFYFAEEVKELPDGEITLIARVDNAEDDATFRSLRPPEFGRAEPLAFAHQNTGALARVVEAKRTSAQQKNCWELTLHLEKHDAGFHSEFSYNGLTPDEIAELRARAILLNAKPETSTKSALDAALFHIFAGVPNTGMDVNHSVLPELWKGMKKNVEAFLPLARLWSVFQVITSETCEHILELSIGPIQDERVHIKFRGRRRKRYSNVEPRVITVEGDCDLAS